jgi:hypothetical protein
MRGRLWGVCSHPLTGRIAEGSQLEQDLLRLLTSALDDLQEDLGENRVQFYYEDLIALETRHEVTISMGSWLRLRHARLGRNTATRVYVGKGQ